MYWNITLDAYSYVLNFHNTFVFFFINEIKFMVHFSYVTWGYSYDDVELLDVHTKIKIIYIFKKNIL